MPTQERNVIASQIEIDINGSRLQPSMVGNLISVEVEQHTHLPAMFTIRMFDPTLELIDDSLFNLTKTVKITANHPDNRSKVVWIEGEITAIEPEFMEGMVAHLVVRGYDKSHRLFRQTKSKTFLNMKDSDLASQMASGASLSAQVEDTDIVYDHIYQDNQTDLAFLMQRAWRIGYECFVNDGKLHFRKPKDSGGGPTLKWGETLVSFLPRATLAEQVDEVLVTGWDVERQQAIVGRASNGNLSPENGEARSGSAWATDFSAGQLAVVDQPVFNQSEANILAEARMNEISGSFVVAEGEAHRSPNIRAGASVKLEKLGSRFSGTYLVTQVRHRYDLNGYWATFMVRGTRTGLLREQLDHSEPMRRWPGVVTAVVTNTDDPKDWGRVKVKFSWMSEDDESDWARIASAGGGPTSGFFAVQAVGDEVLVAFEHGDFNKPYVLGGLWNGKHKIPPEGASSQADERPLVRTWHSRTGHYMAMYDNDQNKVEIVTNGGHKILIDDQNKKVEVVTSGGHKLVMDDNGSSLQLTSSGGHKVVMDDQGRSVSLSSTGTLDIKATSSMKLDAPQIEVSGTGAVVVKGGIIKLN